ncbi:hypothetical protein GCM10017620_08890 [Brevundimonas intermedia]|uniref:Glycine-rich domain-containing protein n=1 Tax=Brevundimonas intermedia TaxID=74315 RepID=A0ABQ5T5R8_9CAUL|nr:DUF2793 domain-containing protein [Brevundimonas intermedia]GLK47916.1 hypothetical protein GCM10017620_08890 [Brevundimonas intermedia]
MSDDFTARLSLPYLAAGQMQKHVTLNAALTRLDALLQTAVVSATTAVQPSAPFDGDLYILPDGANGAVWSGQPAGALMRFEAGGWSRVATSVGLIALVLDAAVLVVRGEDGWAPLGRRLDEVQGLSRLGVGTTADAANPLAVKTNTALFTARAEDEGGDGDLRLTLNKTAAGDVLSLLFQSGYGGRAELGLVGDDDLSLKVSPDGSTWRRAFGVDRATGRVAFDRGAIRRETTVFDADGVYAPPAWARWIEAVCVGGGGAGGAGMAGPAGTARFGGGGGGAGGLSQAGWAVADLGQALAIAVGGGGLTATGGAGGPTTVSLDGVVLLRAGGGARGVDGTAAAGLGGAGGLGLRVGNPGGDSRTTATAFGGGETICPEGAGGGGAGGGLSAGDTARSGGVGGAGAWAGRRADGGAAGAAGHASSAPGLSWVGGGGGGGDASATGAGASGGVGALFGAGGGGGGAGLTQSGAGGAGGGGVVRITAVG